MKNDRILVQHSKFLSLVLRHKPESIGIKLDSEGWTNVQILLHQMIKHNHPLKRKELIELVETNQKKRFQLSDDQTLICAVQGHSSNQVLREYTPITPPSILYHGTATRFLSSILEQGLFAGDRHHVHLSAELNTAKQVGQRHGKVIILTIDTAAMLADGFKFYQAENGVWLSDAIPMKYLSLLNP